MESRKPRDRKTLSEELWFNGEKKLNGRSEYVIFASLLVCKYKSLIQ